MQFALATLLLAVCYTNASTEPHTLVQPGGKYEHALSANDAKNSIGLERFDYDGRKQFFYFCGVAKKKKVCGSWVDEKDNKVKGANNNVVKTKKGITLSKITAADEFLYRSIHSDPKASTDGGLNRLFVQQPRFARHV